MSELDSYAEAHRYDGVTLAHDQPTNPAPFAIQQRDIDVLHDVWQHKFLTANQLQELHWPGRAVRISQRRLRTLAAARMLERFRPLVRTGSYPWTYHLGPEGHRLLAQLGHIPAGARYTRRRVYDYGHVLHEIQLNAWVLAYRRILGDALIEWVGETTITPPRDAAAAVETYAQGLRLETPRMVRPDACLTISREAEGKKPAQLWIEFDRTRRIDKNFDKLRRYDTMLNGWWHGLEATPAGPMPFVVFVCQDLEQRDLFLTAADRELTGSCSAVAIQTNQMGRRRILFAAEEEMHAANADAMRVAPQVIEGAPSSAVPVRLPAGPLRVCPPRPT